MAKLVVEINYLAILHPELAAEANGWDPSTVLSGNNKKFRWKCPVGQRWNATITDRTQTRGGTGCPLCAETGLILINLLGSIFFNVLENSNWVYQTF